MTGRCEGCVASRSICNAQKAQVINECGREEESREDMSVCLCLPIPEGTSWLVRTLDDNLDPSDVGLSLLTKRNNILVSNPPVMDGDEEVHFFETSLFYPSNPQFAMEMMCGVPNTHDGNQNHRIFNSLYPTADPRDDDDVYNMQVLNPITPFVDKVSSSQLPDKKTWYHTTWVQNLLLRGYVTFCGCIPEGVMSTSYTCPASPPSIDCCSFLAATNLHLHFAKIAGDAPLKFKFWPDWKYSYDNPVNHHFKIKTLIVNRMVNLARNCPPDLEYNNPFPNGFNVQHATRISESIARGDDSDDWMERSHDEE